MGGGGGGGATNTPFMEGVPSHSKIKTPFSYKIQRRKILNSKKTQTINEVSL